MPLEPRLRPLVWVARHFGDTDAGVSVLAARAAGSPAAMLVRRAALGPGATVASVEDRLIEVAGGRITLRLYRPEGTGRHPVHLFFHGGGWCTGTVADRDDRCRDLAVGASCVVVSVDYRLAPGNTFPTAPEDCFAALDWVVDHAAEIGVDPRRVSVGGESAGANLAAVICLMARDRGGPRIIFQLLDVPATDLTLEQPSTFDLGRGYVLTRAAMARYVEWYLPDPTLATDPYASPLHAADLSGLPPALITTCEFDPLRDDGTAFAARLEQSGVAVEHRHLAGHIHQSFALPRLLASARAHLDYSVRALRAAYETSTGPLSRPNR